MQSVILFICFIVGAIAPGTEGQECYVDIFQHGNYQGVRNRYFGSVPSLERNDDATSVQVASGCCVELYEHGHFQGDHFRTCKNVIDLNRQWNDRASSLKTYSLPTGWRPIIANEDDLRSMCEGTCDDVGYLSHQPTMLARNCKTVKDCTLATYGWNRGFTRCDYCRCQCEDSRAVVPEVIDVVTPKQFTEPDLYGTCTGTCPRAGLVRTDFGGCKEVRNCRKAYNGWIRGFVRCDHCLCDCVQHKFVNRYELRNVNFRLDEAALSPGKPTSLITMPVRNRQATPQQSTVTLKYRYKNSKSLTTSTSVTAGVSITLQSGFEIEVLKDVKLNGGISTTYSIEGGFTSETGEVIEETHDDSASVRMVVPPGKSCNVMVMGTVMNLDVPYSADLVTIYSDGSESVTRTDGVFSGVETSEFRVDYEKCSPVDGSPPIFKQG